MDERELRFIISQGEGYNLSLKQSYSDSIARDFCAFANANGGRVVIGVGDDNSIKGAAISNRLKSQIQDLARNIDPPLTVAVDEVAGTLAITVPEGAHNPYSANGKFYMRYGANSQQLKRDEIRAFFRKEGLVLFDEMPSRRFDLSKDFNDAAYEEFLRLAGISRVLGRREVLENLGLIEAGAMKNAGALLFCKQAASASPSATIMCALFRGREKVKILDSKEFAADLHGNYEQAFKYVQSKLNTEYIIKGGGPRQERLELPEEALKEAVLNAIAHRDYFSTANIQIYIFSDRVEIVNPGGLVPGMKLSDLGKKSMPRNPLLFGLMQRMELVEQAGTGIARIKSALKERGLKPPKIEADGDWFSITFERPDLQVVKTTPKTREKTREKDYQETIKKLSRNYGGAIEKMLLAIVKKPAINGRELAEAAGLTEAGVRYNLNRLRKDGVLRRVGPDKGGRWEILK